MADDSVDDKCAGELKRPTPEALEFFEAIRSCLNAQSNLRVTRTETVITHYRNGYVSTIPVRYHYGP